MPMVGTLHKWTRAVPAALPPDTDIVRRLSSRLDERSGSFSNLDAAYLGIGRSQSLRLQAAKLSPLLDLRSSFLALCIDVLVERLAVDGFSGPDADEAWRIWEANGMASMSSLLFADALRLGVGFVMVWGDEFGEPVISVESAHQVAVEVSPSTRRVTAALKRWHEDGHLHATLFLPDEVRRFVSVADTGPANLVNLNDLRTVSVEPNPLGAVPVYPVENRLSLIGEPQSELTPLLPLQAAIDHAIASLMVGMEAYALPRRWAVGAEIPTDDAGAPVNPFESMTTTSWAVVEAAEAKLGQFPQADLDPIISSIRTLVEHLCSQAAIPAHLALGQYRGQMISAESQGAAESAMQSKLRRRQVIYGSPLGRAMQTALSVRDGRVPATPPEPIWRSTSSEPLAAQADAATKLHSIGVPLAAILSTVLGFSPEQVASIAPAPGPTAAPAQAPVGPVSSESLRLAAAAHTEGVRHARD